MLSLWIYLVFILYHHILWKKLWLEIILLTRVPDAIINIVDGTNIERNLYLVNTDYGTWYSCNYGC